MNCAILNSKINGLVGNYFREKRIENDMTGSDVSKLLHVSQQQISRYENGLTTISFSLILLFLSELDLSVESFFIYILKELEKEHDILDSGLKLYISLPSREHQYLYFDI